MQLPLIMEGLAVGLLAGAVSVLFRWLLGQAENLRNFFLSLAGKSLLGIGLWFIALMGIAVIVTALLQHEPQAGGSGIPQVEGELAGDIRQNWGRVLWTKIVGGFLCIVAGLSLGREGPSIQLGAMTGKGVSRSLGRLRTEERFLITCGASAGLAAAFNAPLAGVMFALEEVHKSFSPFILLSCMTASITGDCLSRFVFGNHAVFDLATTQPLPLSLYPLVALLGLLCGALGAVYNWSLLKSQDVYAKIPGGTLTHMLLPLLLAGVLGFTFPQVLGGGHNMIDMLNAGMATHLILGLLILKFLFSIISFGSGAPGGIFFPLLVLGAYIGGAYGQSMLTLLGLDTGMTVNFIILAMAGLFSGIVRAPITGIILITEMTGSFSSLLTLSMVSILAYIIAEQLRSEPIYESLLERLLKKNGKTKLDETGEKLVLEGIVERGAPISGQKVSQLELPGACLLIGIRGQDGIEHIPKANTLIRAGDTLVFLTDEAQASAVLQLLHKHARLMPHRKKKGTQDE